MTHTVRHRMTHCASHCATIMSAVLLSERTPCSRLILAKFWFQGDKPGVVKLQGYVGVDAEAEVVVKDRVVARYHAAVAGLGPNVLPLAAQVDRADLPPVFFVGQNRASLKRWSRVKL